MELVILGLGSNKSWNSETSFSLLSKAVQSLKEVLTELRQASLYETEPVPKSGQNNFLNSAVFGFFDGTPEELLVKVHQIEARFGRDRSKEVRWGERSLDIDILLFGNLVVSKGLGSNPTLLEIPHPRLEERRFALQPLLELWPEACSPKNGVPYQKICDELPDQGVKKLK